MIVFDVIAPPRVLPPVLLRRLGVALAHTLRLTRSATVGVRCVSLPEMQRFNRLHRKKSVPTDVLSFTATDEGGMQELMQQERHLGDLVICVPYASHEAKRRGISVQEECVRLLVHGVLHLKGYDHATEQEELEMFRLQEKIVERVLSSL